MFLTCDYCGKEYKTYFSPRCEKHYCSKECSSAAKSTKVSSICSWCGKPIILRKAEIKENNFCSRSCVNLWQQRNKVKLICKICGKEFYRSASWINQRKGYYCSLNCRNKDTEWALKSYYKANQAQCNKKGLNKLELKGCQILDKLNLEYKTQFLINGKICVDVFIPKYNLIIQWDGNYWHGKNLEYKDLDKRQKRRVDLDRSQDAYLKKCGYYELRFWEDEVISKEETVCENIKRTIREIAR